MKVSLVWGHYFVDVIVTLHILAHWCTYTPNNNYFFSCVISSVHYLPPSVPFTDD